MGQLYRRGRVWWVKFYLNGRPIRESTGAVSDGDTPPQEAKRFLKAHEGRAAAGLPVLPRADRVRYDEAAKDLREHYETTGSRDPDEAEKRLKHLDQFFSGRRLASIGGADAAAYVAHRQKDEAANGTINRELAVLSKMLRLAYENGKLLRLPVIRKLKEAAPRSGFLEVAQFTAVCRHLPEDLRVAVTVGYVFGWRVQEVLGLERRRVDLERGTLALDPGSTKNDEGRIVYMPPDVKVTVAAQLARVDGLQRIVPWVFPNLRGASEPNPGRRRVPVLGERRGDFKKAWATACRKAGVPGMLRHDMRRSAVRNMVNAGVPERVAMTVTGHKTRSVFDRYHIVSPGDLQDVARRLTGTIPGTVTPQTIDARLTRVP